VTIDSKCTDVDCCFLFIASQHPDLDVCLGKIRNSFWYTLYEYIIAQQLNYRKNDMPCFATTVLSSESLPAKILNYF